MKKVIAIFLTIASIFSFFILFTNEQSIQRNKMELAEQNLKYNYELLMPVQLSNRDQQGVYTKIKKALDKYQGSIFYSRVDAKTNKQIEFVYTTNPQYFSNFILESGRFFNSNDLSTDKFISSLKTNNPNQIGLLATFGGNFNFEIHTLKDMVDSGYLLDGYCTVSFNNSESINPFISDLEKTFNIDGVQIIPHQTFSTQTSMTNIWIVLSIYFIIMLLVLYDILKSYKTIGVKKLMGFSFGTIYREKIWSLFKIQIVVMLASSIIMTLVMFKSYNKYLLLFLSKLGGIYVIEIIALFVICSIPFLYIPKIRISNMLKNKQPTTEIMILNFCVKAALLVIFIIAINQGIGNFNRVRAVFTNSYKQWDDLKSYAVIPNMVNIPIDYMDSKEFRKIQKEMYLVFNRQGAILADFDEYLPATRKLRMSETKYEYQRDNVVVNPNYLAKYPVYDENGNRILISESDKDYTVLVPDKYKSEENAIKTMFERFEKGYGYNEPIKIIWTKSNQKVFSMLMDVNPNGGNYVKDPIIRVLTESNGADDDYDTILGIDGNPFKIKVQDYLNPGNSIRPVLKEFGMDKYVKTISSVNQEIASESKNVKEMLQELLLTIISTGVCIVILMLQNIYNFFEKYKQHLAIKHLHGYKNLDKYDNYFLIIIANWAVVIISTIFTKSVSIIILLQIASLGILLESIITLLVLTSMSRKRIIKIIKGAE